jgi:signal transduction histidine kinase/CheY-like chemotaxis protein
MSDQDARVLALEAELERVRTDTQQQMLDQIPDMVVSVDANGNILEFNNSALIQLGAETEGRIGGPLADLFEQETGSALFALCLAGFTGVGDSEVQLRDGRTMSFSVRRVGENASFVVLRDVSQREQLEVELRHARRMASVGRLAGEVAHEINNPLAVIQGRLEMLRAVPEMPLATRQRHLDIIEDQGGRVARIVKNLQVFAQPRIPDPEWLELAECIKSAVQTSGRRLERVSVEVDVVKGLQAYGDRNQCDLVWENLLGSVANITPAGRSLLVTAMGLEGGSVRVRIDSQGGSWPKELLAEMRSPYSGSGYRVGPGHGLALAISWGIVQEHGGWMTAENLPGAGASVELMFPAPVIKVPAPVMPSSGVRSRDILVVDDDPVMGETLSWMISTHGHRAVVVQSAEEAVQRLHRELFDVLITDQRLPGMDGEALLEVVRQEWPDMIDRSVLTSGLLHRPRDGQLYLQKPFSRAQLGQLLKEML